jgi:hypothetical protein
MNPLQSRKNALIEIYNTNGAHRRIFRSEAVERYCRNYEASVIPRLARPRTFAVLWALLALILLIGSIMTRSILQRLSPSDAGAPAQSTGPHGSTRPAHLLPEGAKE